MKKRIILTSICFILLSVIFVQFAFAVTETIIIKPNYTEDTVIFISFKDGQEPGCAEYIYTGKKIKPEVVVKKVDKTVADPSEYKITYDEDCEKTGVHMVTAEYLKTGYKVSMDYWVVPGTTNNIDVTVKNGKVTLSWASVPGATCYRVYKYDISTGNRAEVYWEDGSIAAPKTSRTLSDLERGKTYRFGIMALPAINWMPTNQIKIFEFTVSESGESSKTTTVEKTTAAKEEETKSEEVETVATTVVQPTTEETTTEVTQTKESSTKAKTTLKKDDSTTQKDNNENNEKTESDVWKVIPIAVAVVIVGVGTGIVIYKKKK